MAKAKHEHYVNNKEFTAAVIKWVRLYKEAKAKGEDTPQIPEYVSACFLKIAKRYSTRPNFSGYTYKDDMIAEALYTCTRYAHNFKEEISNNAFAYFTQYTHNAFINLIKKENKYSRLKFDVLKEANVKMGKNDFNDITLFYEDEDNTGIAEIEKTERKILSRQLTPIEELLKDEYTSELMKSKDKL